MNYVIFDGYKYSASNFWRVIIHLEMRASMSTSDANNAPDQDDTGDLISPVIDATTLAIGEECGCWGCEPIDVYPPLEGWPNEVTTLALGEEGGFCETWPY
jgi:hypothetical protein